MIQGFTPFFTRKIARLAPLVLPTLSQRFTSLVVLTVAVMCLSSAHAQQSTIRITGTGAGAGLMQQLGLGYKKRNPNVKVDILTSLGSSGGIKALLSGSIELAISARMPNATEATNGAIGIALAETPFVLATGLNTPIDNLQAQQLVKIYNGEMPRWSDGTVIRPLLRPEVDDDTRLLKTMASGMDAALVAARQRSGLKVAITDTEAADDLETIPGSIGGSTLAVIITEKRKLKPIAIDGVMPSIKTLTEGKYPYFKTLYLVLTASPSPTTKEFLEFIKSPEGIKIITASGCVVPGKS